MGRVRVSPKGLIGETVCRSLAGGRISEAHYASKVLISLDAARTTPTNSTMVISEEKRLKMVELRGRGFSHVEISTQLGVGKATVQRWLARFDETGLMKTKPKSGRPHCTSAQEDAALCTLALENPTFSAPRLILARDESAPSVSTSTVRRILHRAGLRQKVAKAREAALCTERVQQLRLNWAESIEYDWTGWSDRTCYVDECTFSTFYSYRQQVWVSREHRGRVQRLHRRPGRCSISVFGGVCGDQLLPLYIVSKSFTSAQCADVLSLVYWPVMNELTGGEEFKIQMDNAKTHRGYAVVQARLDSEFGDSIMFQPPYSPDLNPVEHVSARMKRILRRRVYGNKDQLRRAVLKAWDEVSRDRQFLARLTSSMPRRLNAGGPTRY